MGLGVWMLGRRQLRQIDVCEREIGRVSKMSRDARWEDMVMVRTGGFTGCYEAEVALSCTRRELPLVER